MSRESLGRMMMALVTFSGGMVLLILAFSMTASSEIITVDDDGKADFSSIQDAINYAMDGDLIQIREGDYSESLLVNKSVTLRGDGMRATRIVGHSYESDTIIVTADGAHLEDLNLSSLGKSWSTTAALRIESSDCTITRILCTNSAIGILLENANLTTISQCHIVGNLNGINLENSHNNTLLNTDLEENSDASILFYDSNDNLVRENTCHSTDDTSGITIIRSNGNSIIDNHCSSDPPDRFDFALSGGIWIGDSNDSHISANVCSNNMGYGIFLTDSINATIENNSCLNNGKASIALGDSDQIRILRNTLQSEARIGIFIDDSSNITAQGNVLDGDFLRISLSETEFWETITIGTTNVVNGRPVILMVNQTNPFVPSNAAQVILVNCTNIALDGLNCSEGRTGIRVMGSSYISIKNSVCSDNYRNGIRIEESSEITLTNNRCDRNVLEGIYVEGDRAILSDNKCSGNINGITVDGTGNQIIRNFCSNNVFNDSLDYESDNIFDLFFLIFLRGDGMMISGNDTIISMNVCENDSIVIAFLENSIVSDHRFGKENGLLFALCLNITLKNNVFEGSSPSIFSFQEMSILPFLTLVADRENLSSELDQLTTYQFWTTHSIDNSNTVNGKPILYLLNTTSAIIDDEYGAMILVNCSDVIIKNHTMTDTSVAIQIGFSSDILIMYSSFTQNGIGVSLTWSERCRIENSTFDGDSGMGTAVIWSPNTSISNCRFKNLGYAVYVGGSTSYPFPSSYPIFEEYDLPDTSSDCVIWHNKFSGNDKAVIGGDSNELIDARYNDWGSASGPYNEKENPKGRGDEISDFVLFDPWIGKGDLDFSDERMVLSGLLIVLALLFVVLGGVVKRSS